MQKLEKRLRLIKRWLPGAAVKVIDGCLEISHEDVMFYIPQGFTYEMQRTLYAIRDSGVQTDIETYLRSLPSSLEECREFQEKRKVAFHAETARIKAEREAEKDKRRAETEAISNFVADLTVRWEHTGLDEWDEPAPEDPDVMIHVVWPRFQYSLQSGGNTMSFTLSWELCEGEYWDEYEKKYIVYPHHDIRATDVQGNEPSWDWRENVDIDSLYWETYGEFAAGERKGEIVPTWLTHLLRLP